MKYNSIYNNFSSGELSRHVKGRTDIEEYYKGVAEMTNFLPQKQGGATFRPGTFIAGGEFGSVRAGALFEFSPRDDESYYVLCQPGSALYIEDAFNNTMTISTATYPWNERPNFEDSSKAYSGPASAADEEEHRLIIDSLQVAYSGDVMIIVDGTGRFAPIVVIRKAKNSFVIDSLIHPTQINADLGVAYLLPPAWSLRQPFKDTNVNSKIRLKPSATSGAAITITAENDLAAAINFFKGDVVGMLVKITHSGTTGVARIISKTSDSSVNAFVEVNFGAITASSNHEVSAWNPNDGYPRSVAFFEQRLIFGGSKTFPDTLWISMTGNIYHFMQRRLAQDSSTDASGLNFYGAAKVTDPFSAIPASVKANSIQWLFPSDTLLVGTSTTEFSVTSTQDSSFNLASILIRPISSHGSSKVQPVKVGASVLFIAGDGKRVLEIPKRLVEYTSATDFSGLSEGIVDKAIDMNANDVTTIVKLKNKIRKMAWDDSTGVLWCLCKNSEVGTIGSGDSALISLTADKTSKTLGWAKHKLAQTPYISSIAMIPDVTNPGSSKLFMFLYRDSSNSYSLEYFSYMNQYDALRMGHQEDTDTGGRCVTYMDGTCICGNSYLLTDGTKGRVNTGEIVLAGAQTSAFPAGTTYGVFEINSGTGTYLGTFVEVAGKLAVPSVVTTKEYVVGVLYEGEIKTMPIEAGAQFGVAQGSTRRGHEFTIGVDRSLGGSYYASKATNEFDIIEDEGTEQSLYTGEIRKSLNASPDDHQTVIKQKKPFPLTVLWLLTKGYTYDV